MGVLDGIQWSLGKLASTNKPRYDRSPSPTRRQAQKLAYFACGEEGHFAANCPKIRHKSVSWVSGGDGDVSCPLSDDLNTSGRIRRPDADSGNGHVTDMVENSSAELVDAWNVATVSDEVIVCKLRSGSMFCVPFSSNQQPTQAVVAAEVSLISDALYRKLDPRPTFIKGPCILLVRN